MKRRIALFVICTLSFGLCTLSIIYLGSAVASQSLVFVSISLFAWAAKSEASRASKKSKIETIALEATGHYRIQLSQIFNNKSDKEAYLLKSISPLSYFVSIRYILKEKIFSLVLAILMLVGFSILMTWIAHEVAGEPATIQNAAMIAFSSLSQGLLGDLLEAFGLSPDPSGGILQRSADFFIRFLAGMSIVILVFRLISIFEIRESYRYAVSVNSARLELEQFIRCILISYIVTHHRFVDEHLSPISSYRARDQASSVVDQLISRRLWSQT